MYADQRRRVASQLAFEERDKLFVAVKRAITRNLEVAPRGRQIRYRHPLNRKLAQEFRAAALLGLFLQNTCHLKPLLRVSPAVNKPNVRIDFSKLSGGFCTNQL